MPDEDTANSEMKKVTTMINKHKIAYTETARINGKDIVRVEYGIKQLFDMICENLKQQRKQFPNKLHRMSLGALLGDLVGQVDKHPDTIQDFVFYALKAQGFDGLADSVREYMDTLRW